MAQTEFQRRQQKVLRFMKARGLGGRVDSTETARHVRALCNKHGMSISRVAQLAGVSQACAWELYYGQRKAHGPNRPARAMTDIHWTTRDKVLAVEPEPIVGMGARMPMVGSMRRLHAMTYDGFSGRLLGAQLGWSTQRVSLISRGAHKGGEFIFASTAQHIAEVYDKMNGVDPIDLGSNPVSVMRARNHAVRSNFAPRHCWDDDTIDNPESFAEWTGACGTSAGYRIHKREQHQFGNHIFACEPCRKAYAEDEKDQLSLRAQAGKLLADGKSMEEIVEQLGVHKRTVLRAMQEGGMKNE